MRKRTNPGNAHLAVIEKSDTLTALILRAQPVGRQRDCPATFRVDPIGQQNTIKQHAIDASVELWRLGAPITQEAVSTNLPTAPLDLESQPLCLLFAAKTPQIVFCPGAGRAIGN